ncbi:MAG: Cof-type HAD-IIB family hydrolase [Bacteroides sp.]|nr:Cof-type HAD-IIB family hydrolase [Bacteroides sp.]
MTKALFFDIDGTLVSFHTHEVPASTLHALAEAKARGLQLFIATGRPKVIINNLDRLQEQGLIDGYITMNGAYCFVGDEVIHKSSIPMEEVKAITGYCAERRIPCIEVSEHDIYANHPGNMIQQIFHEHLKVTTPIPDTPLETALSNGPIFQITPFLNAEQEAELWPHLSRCEVGRWHPAFVDVTAKGNTKQRGMDAIISHFGLKLEETMAFGDGGNDIPMLRHAGIGIAMGNAQENVKAEADYVTDTVDNDGIARALHHFGILPG